MYDENVNTQCDLTFSEKREYQCLEGCFESNYMNAIMVIILLDPLSSFKFCHAMTQSSHSEIDGKKKDLNKNKSYLTLRKGQTSSE